MGPTGRRQELEQTPEERLAWLYDVAGVAQ